MEFGHIDHKRLWGAGMGRLDRCIGIKNTPLEWLFDHSGMLTMGERIPLLMLHNLDPKKLDHQQRKEDAQEKSDPEESLLLMNRK